MMYRFFIKRFFDFCIAISALIVLFPILLIVMVLLYFANERASVFFTQVRPGKNAKLFKIIKFKTMTDKCDTEGHLLPDSERLTKIGAFIRSISLDELPQLINVLKGDMSLIGPRPLLPSYLLLYNEVQFRRHEVRPGITGWAQVNGRNNISWGKKFELDVYYVENISLLLDIKIFFKTIIKTVKRDGIVKDGMVTTEAFNGYN